ncbi:PP2C family serine/threonine-protein phosphatase [Caballeronia sp. BR00000012568055]|uniref:PP2C family protein-serine/threonine phosphatase n=1 Tax=Caballeronia sp. BR00000012568055 TaxID=2918761 RepID=UPI0023F71D84|nr:protein phosphatase 2C domain-containing protein [Caballeronia sp. BR00000012568055]
MRFDLASITDQGGRRRNEDRLALIEHRRLFAGVVADGAGGHGGGDVAAQLVVDTVSAALRECAGRGDGMQSTLLTDALIAANEAIVKAQAAGGALARMRSTAAVLAIDPLSGHAIWAHCGDTRIYCFRRGHTAFQTIDHSMVQQLVDANLLAPREMRRHPLRNLLLAALGTEDALPVQVAAAPFAIADGDVFLVCSDGLWEHIDESAMIDAIGHADDAESWLTTLAARVKRAAPPRADNLSAVAIWAGAPREATVLERAARKNTQTAKQ